MAEFTAEVYQNEFLPEGGTDVNAIVTVTCAERDRPVRPDPVMRARSSSSTPQARWAAPSSMPPKWRRRLPWIRSSTAPGSRSSPAPIRPTSPFLWYAPERAWSGWTCGTDRPHIKRSANSAPTEARRWEPGSPSLAGSSTRCPELVQRHAILLTDGENHNETPEQLTNAIMGVTGKFQCDCRGVGVDWQVAEVRRIAQALLGSVDIIPEPDQMSQVFAELMQQSMSRGVADAQLTGLGAAGRAGAVRTPGLADCRGSDSPPRRGQPLTGGYPTGSWGDESRDYHVSVRLAAKAIGQEQLAARVQLAVANQVVAQSMVKAKWSDDEGLTTRINPEVAHYTGQTELAEAIQEGLAAKSAGDEETATTKLGRAVQLAAETGNEEATTRLRKVVDIEDSETGTVRLKRAVDKADEMALDTASTKTTRIRG